MSDPEAPVIYKLIFWLLAALFAIMTGIGGFTAAHIVSQIDTVDERISHIEASMAATEVYRADTEKRLDNLEYRLNSGKK